MGRILDSNKTHKYIVHGIPADTGVHVVKEFLKGKGIHVINVTQMQLQSGIPYPMFLITVPEGPDSNKVKELEELCHVSVRIEPFRLRGGPPQCSRCHTFFHTAVICMNRPRCRHCSGEHFQWHCRHTPDTEPKCCNCEG